MILDNSAVVAILLREPRHATLLAALASAPGAGIGAPTLSEAGIVLAARLGVGGRTLLARFMEESALTLIPFANEHWAVSVEAFLRFGKGRHPAKLNFGDCLTYATARLAAEPLLCVGNDFARTDLELVG